MNTERIVTTLTLDVPQEWFDALFDVQDPFNVTTALYLSLESGVLNLQILSIDSEHLSDSNENPSSP